MTCAICAQIPDSLYANTGRDEHLPESTRPLKSLGRGDTKALWECPTCGGLYVWTEYVAQTGSGNNDEETLTRISAERLATIGECLARGDAPVAEWAQRVGDALFAFPQIEINLVVSRIHARDRELARALYPRLLTLLVRTTDRSLRNTLAEWASDPEDARRLLALIEATPARGADEEFAVVRYACRKSLGISD